MANTIRVPRAHLILALCLPLAVILGYFLTAPTDLSGVVVLTVVLGTLAVPFIMRWHHLLLVLSWNAWISLTFLPGSPDLWIVAAAASFFFAVLNRSVNPEKAFLHVPSLLRPLLFFACVVFGTALLTGGIGFQVLGSGQSGGRIYLQLFAAVLGYLALSSTRIPADRAGLYTALFFFPG